MTAEYAHFTARKALALFAEHEALISRVKGPQKKSVLAVYRQLQQRPVSDAKALSTAAGVNPQPTLKALERLEKLGLVRWTCCRTIFRSSPSSTHHRSG